MSGDWRNDPRVKEMDPQKIEFLEDLTNQIRQTPRHQIMNRFLATTLEASRRGIVFTDQETELLTAILAEYMPPADRDRISLLRMLARRMAKSS